MAKKKEDERPNSYPVTQIGLVHLEILHDNLLSIIDILEPSFYKAEAKHDHTPDSHKGREKAGEAQLLWDNEYTRKRDYRLLEPDNTLIWIRQLTAKVKEISNFSTSDVIDEKALKTLRNVRAIAGRLVGHSKNKDTFINASNFKFQAPELSKLLTNRVDISKKEGGVFNLLDSLLQGEEIDWEKDLSNIKHTTKVGKTLRAVLVEYKLELMGEKTPEATELTSQPESKKGNPPLIQTEFALS